MPAPNHARTAAARLLGGVFTDGRMLAEQVASGDGPLSELTGPEKAAAQRLATGTLRHLGAIDKLLSRYLQRMPPQRVRDILRVATYEICVDGAADYGVVSDAVNRVRAVKKTVPMAGMVNAVLRKVAADGPTVWGELPVTRLPKGLRPRLVSVYGARHVAAMEAAHAMAVPLDITEKDGDWSEPLGAERLPTGSLRRQGTGQVSALPGYAEGAWWVQDAAAAMAANLFSLPRGARVADLCAAPGGKTLQMSARGYHVTAVDLSEARLARLRENLDRTGLDAQVVAADALDWMPDAPLDGVLLDAPCSATGTIRRHPDLPHLKTAAGVKPLIALQARLIDKAVEVLADGGEMVFCTCSLLPEEGEDQLEGLLTRHPMMELVAHPDLPAPWQAPGGGLRLTPDLWPERGGLDGFFIAHLRKRGSA